MLRAWKLGLATSHRVPSSMSWVTWGQSVQSQPLRAWKLGLTTSHRVPMLCPKSREVNPCNLSCWEHGSWDLRLHTGSQVLSRVTWGRSVQSQPLRAWKLGLTTSYGSLKNRFTHGAWSRTHRSLISPLITPPTGRGPGDFWAQSVEILVRGRFTRRPKSWVPSHLRSICAISAIENMEIGTCHFTRAP